MTDETKSRWTPPRIPLIILSLLVIGLNAFDGYGTLWACRSLGAVELNPVMAAFLRLGPGTFMAVKTIGVTLAVLVLVWSTHHQRVRDGMRKFAWCGLIGLNLVYAAVVFMHVLVITGRITPPEVSNRKAPVCAVIKNRP